MSKGRSIRKNTYLVYSSTIVEVSQVLSYKVECKLSEQVRITHRVSHTKVLPRTGIYLLTHHMHHESHP